MNLDFIFPGFHLFRSAANSFVTFVFSFFDKVLFIQVHIRFHFKIHVFLGYALVT